MALTQTLTPWDRLRSHWAAPAWLRTAHVVTGAPVALLALAVIGGLAAVSIIFIWTIVVPLVALPLMFWLLPKLTGLQRGRFAAFLSVEIPAARRRPGTRNPIRFLYAEIRDPRTWRQLAYHLLAPLITGVGLFAMIVAWSGALASLAVAIGYWTDRGTVEGEGWLVLILAGALAVAGPWAARLICSVDEVAAVSLLGPSAADVLTERVESLRESRAEVIDAADAERRRMERDLHDGAQRRLVWLAMNLGMARTTLTDLPEPARQVIAQAHDEAKLALKELRDLVRGLHPAVLDEQGLDAALSGVAARSPVPVRLTVDVDRRPSPTIEAVAFFVVSEALTNVAKHAQAHEAFVTVRREGDRLIVEVLDDGRGGADPAEGSGLRGLIQRAGSVDGVITILSPEGGPTTIRADLPCG
ncbi:sensor histidine kinase [Herbidospora sp. NBRC 101105]|uniref:sensor histidine kinase n=1 Tax=Herbidospora sp. NBRC 101105 TaxID=3032195 RepID=UPI0024A2FE0F|nr:sensor histidine kinase [Herbidospora sp. NBRC 101105]GLX97741.1 histidine kinase [Herbidospora sp. NBRC 101105]